MVSGRDTRIHQNILATHFDAYLGQNTHFLSNRIQSQGAPLRLILAELPSSSEQNLQKIIGKETLETLMAISETGDTRRFFKELLAVAKGSAEDGRRDVGIGLLHHAQKTLEKNPSLQEKVGPEITQAVHEELAAMSGRGPVSRRSGYMVNDVSTHLLDPIQFGGYFLGIGFFQKARYLTASRLLNPMVKSFWRNGLGTHLASYGAALGAESAALTVGMRGIYQLAGHEMDWSPRRLWQDFLWTGGEMGTFRAAHALAFLGIRRKFGLNPLNPLAKPVKLTGWRRGLEIAGPQTAVFGALTATTAARAWFSEVHYDGDWANIFAESLAKYIPITTGNYLFNRYQPKWFRDWSESTQAHFQMHLPRLGFSSRTTKGDWFPDFDWPLPIPFPKPLGPEFSKIENSRGTILSSERVRNIIERFSKWQMVKKKPEEEPAAPSRRRSGRIPRTSLIQALSKTNFDGQPFERAPLPILVTDAGGKIIYANPLAKAIFPRHPEGESQRFEDIFIKIAGEESTYGLKNEVGTKALFEETAHQVAGNEGLTIRYLQDISRLRQLEDYREIGLELRRALHDSNNLWFLIGAFKDMALEPMRRVFEKHGTEEKYYQRALSLSRDFLLAFENLTYLFTAGRKIAISERRPQEFYNFSEALEIAARTQTRYLENQRMELKLDLEPNLIAHGNRHFMVHAAINLIRNALEAMEPGGKLVIRSRKQDQELILEVSDTGSGISPENLPRIFDEQFSTKPEGAGIGLGSVKRTIERLHAGKIEVDSQLGTGTTFRIRLPLPEDK